MQNTNLTRSGKIMTTGFEIGEIVEMKHSDKRHRHKAVVLGFEPNKLFDSVQCVKVMIIGRERPTFTLSDRIVKL